MTAWRRAATLAIALAAACASDGTSPSGDVVAKVYAPTVPIPESLWKPPSGSTPTTGSYVYLEADPSLAPA